MNRIITYLDNNNKKCYLTCYNYNNSKAIESHISLHISDLFKIIAIKKPKLCSHCQDGYIWLPDKRLEKKFRIRK